MFQESFSQMDTFDKASEIAFLVGLVLAVVFLVVFIIMKKYRPELLPDFKKTTIGLSVGYAIGVSALLLFLKLDKYFAKDKIDLTTFIPVVCLLSLIIVLAVVGLILAAFKKEQLGLYTKIAAGIIGAALLAIIIAHMVILYKGNDKVEVSKEVILYVLTAVLVAIDVVLAFVLGKKHPEHNRTKTIVYAGVFMAMSFALSYVKLFSLPQGGSITFASLLPLMIFSYMFGIRKGLVVGAIYGLLQFIQSPWFNHPAQFLLDYPIAFGGIGLAGLFKELNLFNDKKILQFVLGAVLASVLRYFAHVMSGIFVFGSGDPNYSAVAWSFLYNSFTFADIAICIVAGAGLFASKSFTSYLEKATV